MKTKITLLLIVTLINISNVFSQSLSNSTWSVFDTSNKFFVRFNFKADTLSYSTDNISYTPVSTYQVNDNNFTIKDLSSGPCPTDIGQYNFLIQNDTLKFTLISDLCATRPTTFTNYHWVRILTTMNSLNAVKPMIMYPSPTIDILTIPIDGEKNITVTNLQGQIIKTIITNSKTISLVELASGSYIVSVYNAVGKLRTARQIIYKK